MINFIKRLFCSHTYARFTDFEQVCRKCGKSLLILLLLLVPQISFAAVAHVSTVSFFGASPQTQSITASAGDVMIYYGTGDTSDNLTAAQWNSQSFTKYVGSLGPSTRYDYIWCLNVVTGGTANFTSTGITDSSVMSVSVYSGAGTCKNGVHSTGSGTSASINASPTPASSSWLVGGNVNSVAVGVAGTNTTKRSTLDSAAIQGDSNGTASPTALNWTWGGSSANWSGYLIELPVYTAPASAPTSILGLVKAFFW